MLMLDAYTLRIFIFFCQLHPWMLAIPNCGFIFTSMQEFVTYLCIFCIHDSGELTFFPHSHFIAFLFSFCTIHKWKHKKIWNIFMLGQRILPHYITFSDKESSERVSASIHFSSRALIGKHIEFMDDLFKDSVQSIDFPNSVGENIEKRTSIFDKRMFFWLTDA